VRGEASHLYFFDPLQSPDVVLLNILHRLDPSRSSVTQEDLPTDSNFPFRLSLSWLLSGDTRIRSSPTVEVDAASAVSKCVGRCESVSTFAGSFWLKCGAARCCGFTLPI
jgi:hypothetical protein